eukprot:2853958-Pyramimonas_sp.AAC.1
MEQNDVVLEGEPAGGRFLLRARGQTQYAARKISHILGKSACRVKREIISKQVKKALAELYPQHHFHVNKEKGE